MATDRSTDASRCRDAQADSSPRRAHYQGGLSRRVIRADPRQARSRTSAVGLRLDLEQLGVQPAARDKLVVAAVLDKAATIEDVGYWYGATPDEDVIFLVRG